MKKRLIIFYSAIILATLATSCVKVIDKFNSNNLTVTFNNQGSLFLTGDKTVNPKDSIKFSYSVVCTQPMSYLTLTKNDTEIARDSVKTGDRTTISNLVKKFVADTIPGQYIYKVVARDNTGIYLGASDPIIVTITSDFNYYTNKRIYVPDTTAKTNKTYFNLTTETAYSYSDIIANKNSDQIDLGFYWDPAIASGTTPKGISLYNLGSSFATSTVSFYDISTFTKNLTAMVKYSGSTSWLNFNSGGFIKAQCATALKTIGTSNYYLSGLAAGNIILFKTASGKYGALNILYVSQSSAGPGTYINFEVKMPK